MTEQEEQDLLDQASELIREAARLTAQVCESTGAARSAGQIAETLGSVTGTALIRAAKMECWPAEDEGDTA